MNYYKQQFNKLELPEEWLKTLKIKLKLWDNETIWWIIDYLKLDSFELVQNMAKVINKDNASDSISFRDGWLARNTALMNVLAESTKKKEYFDRLSQKKKTVI